MFNLSLTVFKFIRLSSGYRNGPLEGCICREFRRALLSSKKLKGLEFIGVSGLTGIIG